MVAARGTHCTDLYTGGLVRGMLFRDAHIEGTLLKRGSSNRGGHTCKILVKALRSPKAEV